MVQQCATSWLTRKVSILLIILAIVLVGLSPPGADAITNPGGNGVAKSSVFAITPPWAAGGAAPIISGYGPNAGSPDHKNGVGRPQDYFALDFGMPVGTSVYPAASGTVMFAAAAIQNYAGYGNLVFIDHGNGYQSIYAHLDTILVTVNQSVTTSTPIGTSGRTGLDVSQPAHLHFALYTGAMIVTDFSTQPSGQGPGHGSSVVPEPFNGCVKNQVAATCADLVRTDVLYRPLLEYRNAGAYGAGSDCRTPNSPAPTNWRWRVSGVPASFTPSRLIDNSGGIWQNTQFYPCASPWRWLLVPLDSVAEANGAIRWRFHVAAWPGAVPNSARTYTVELRDANGRSFGVNVTW